MTLGVVEIGGIPVKMGCSADTLRKYRIKFGRDLIKDLQKITTEDRDTQCLEMLAYTMACQGDPEMDMDIDQWLDQFGPLDVITASEEIIKLWGLNTVTSSKSKKKSK